MQYAVHPSVLGVVGLHAATPDKNFSSIFNELYSGYERTEQLCYRVYLPMIYRRNSQSRST